MVITNAKYAEATKEENETKSIYATIDGVASSVPMDTANRHYAEILKQVADGDITIAEAD
jgi:hypothetical protein